MIVTRLFITIFINISDHLVSMFSLLAVLLNLLIKMPPNSPPPPFHGNTLHSVFRQLFLSLTERQR